MKKYVSVICAFLIVICFSNLTNVSANVNYNYVFLESKFESITGKCGKSIVWFLNENTKELRIVGQGRMYNYDNLSYETQSPFAYQSSFEKVIVDEGVTSIGNFTFYGSAIKDIQLPTTLNIIGKNALAQTKLKSLFISKNISRIDITNFDIWELKEIVVDRDNNYFSSLGGVLFNKSRTKLIVYPKNKNICNYSVPLTVEVIGNSAFKNVQRLKSINFSKNLQRISDNAFIDAFQLREVKDNSNKLKFIGDNAFNNCYQLKEFTIGEKVTYIGIKAFSLCSNLKNFYVDMHNKKYRSKDGVVFSKNLKVLILFPCGREGKYSVPKNVNKIKKYAFESSSISLIILNKNLENIGISAFENCEELTKIFFKGTKIFEIGKRAFNKGYDNGIFSSPSNVKIYTQNQKFAKLLKKKLVKSGLKYTKLYYKKDNKNIEIVY